MKVLKATLAFVMGLVLGIILLVLAVGGTVVALGTTRTVGELQQSVTNTEIISPDSELYGQTVLEAVKKALNDYQNFDDISLKLLYERYGINLLNGISGLDFTQKSFYDAALTDIVKDLSILLDDFYLSDVEKITGMDFSMYNIPLLHENMNIGITKAIEKIVTAVKSDVSLRFVEDKLGFDLGVEKNAILKTLRDVKLSEIGGLIDALPLGSLLTADVDKFLPLGASVQVYESLEGKAEEWEEVTQAELEDPDYTAPLGVETYIAGGTEDGELILKELRYYKYEGMEPYVDNSCYNENWTMPENVTLLRHRRYREYKGNGKADGKYFVVVYGNHVKSVNGTNSFTLVDNGFYSLDDLLVGENGAKLDKTLIQNGKLNISEGLGLAYAEKGDDGKETGKFVVSPQFSVLDEKITVASLLRTPSTEEEHLIPGRPTYVRVYLGTSSPILQYLNFLSIGYVRNDTDAILKSVRIGDIIDTDAPGTAEILKALKNSTLDSIGKDINTLTFGQMIQNDDNNRLLNAISDFTLDNIDENIDNIYIGDLVDTNDPNTAPILKALKDKTIKELPTAVNTLEIAQIIEITDDSPSILVALANRKATLDNMDDIMEKLTVRELLEIDFHEYREATSVELADENTPKYSRLVTDHVKIDDELLADEALLAGVYGEYPVRGNYDEATEVFTPDENGEWIEVYCYIYDDSLPQDGEMRYVRTKEGNTAIAVQSLANRGVPALEMGDHLNNLTIGELMPIDKESSHMFKTLALKGSTLDSISKDVDELEVADLIKIDEDSSPIMKALKNRHCKLGEMGTITDTLTIGEMMEITYDDYPEDDDGTYVRVHDGDSSYYTLYNPAVHNEANENVDKKEDGSVQRYRKEKAEDASSGILQRYAGSTLGDFSSSFDSIMMSDVMDMDIDIYAPLTADQITQQEDGKYVFTMSDHSKGTAYYYDSEVNVYRIAGQEMLKNAKERPESAQQLYFVSHPGESTAILKKLAYVPVSELEDAMNAVMQDLTLSEIIDVYNDDAVELATDDAAPTDDDFFFIEWDGKTKINGREAVYVYDGSATGKYFMSKFYDETVTDESQLTKGGVIYYQYKSLKEYVESGNNWEKAQKELVDSGNIFVKYSKGGSDQYVWNLPYASYLFAQAIGNLGGSSTYLDILYYRAGAEAGTSGALSVQTYTDENLYVNILGNAVKYERTNPAHDFSINKGELPEGVKAPEYKFYFRHGSDAKEAEAKYFAPIGEKKYNFNRGSDITYGAQYCNDVYFKISADDVNPATGKTKDGKNYDVYVYTGTGYLAYADVTNPDPDKLYIKKIGYVASFGEAYYIETNTSDHTSTAHTTLDPKKVTVERRRSTGVLRMMGDQTISDMNSVIETATMEDFIEITPGTIFDNDEIRAATVNNLGSVLSNMFMNMTIGELLSWSNISGVDAAVVEALNDVSITEFFMSLTYNKGTISIDMHNLYGGE